MRTTILLVCLAYFSKAQQSFDANFRFGVATASYQVEGAWNEDGKGENIWDHLTHTQSDYIDDQSTGDIACDTYHKTAQDVQLLYIDDQSTGDIACDTYHKTAQDVQLLVDLGVDFYRFSISWSRIFPSGHDRFSISWSRIFPSGHANYTNQAGIDYYNGLINELLANGITPMVTMFQLLQRIN
ncbi:Glycosyl hydrolase family 1 [Popillia japonica]|uniref:Glycosyl hydrolase family 1 n=1 Tax=Popillia japonica TaxID=7064 RepID=A0AAW1KQ71_POPJA